MWLLRSYAIHAAHQAEYSPYVAFSVNSAVTDNIQWIFIHKKGISPSVSERLVLTGERKLESFYGFETIGKISPTIDTSRISTPSDDVENVDKSEASPDQVLLH